MGSPIREDLFRGDAELAKKNAGFTEDRPVLLVMGGSIGSVKINTSLRRILPELLQTFNVIHLCGKNNLEERLMNTPGYKQYEYVVDEMKDILNAADLIVSRAGANSIFEFLALRKPNLLIPLSMSSSRGDQIENAASFLKNGYSMVLNEENLNDVTLRMSIERLYEEREEFINAMGLSELGSATDKIIELIEKYSR